MMAYLFSVCLFCLLLNLCSRFSYLVNYWYFPIYICIKHEFILIVFYLVASVIYIHCFSVAHLTIFMQLQLLKV